MIQHIVMWKFREGTEAQAEEFLTRLAALDGQIECIRSMAVRRSAVPGSAYDAVLVSEFDTLEDVARYSLIYKICFDSESDIFPIKFTIIP